MAVTNTGNLHNLTTLIKRLEAATSRLEDIATSVDASHPETVAAISTAQAAIAENAAAATAATAPAALHPPEPLPRSIEDFDTLISDDVKPFVIASEAIGGLVQEQAQAVQQAFEAERTYLLITTKAKKPDPQPPELLKELHRHTSSVDEIRENNRASPLFQHLSAVSEGIVALGWIVESRPADFITEILGGAQYYGNKVLKEHKDSDPEHGKFIQAYYKIFKSLIAYVKQHYATGLMWNNKDGVDVAAALKEVQSGPSTPKANGTSGAAPPPPPMPSLAGAGAPPPPPLPAAGGASKGGDMTAVFSQLNQGSAVTAGLKKVDKSEMTHKNPSLRAGGTVPQRSSSQTSGSSTSTRGKSPMPNKKPESMRAKKPMRKELDGNKWIVENIDNTGQEVHEINAEPNHSILISRSTKCIIKINGKANAISIDNCTGLSILVDSLISSLDVIKSPKFQVQINGVVPTVLLDQVDGATIYLGKESLATEVFTSKCASVNIVLPPRDEENEDDKECPLPEQIRSVVKDGQLVHEIVEHAG